MVTQPNAHGLIHFTFETRKGCGRRRRSQAGNSWEVEQVEGDSATKTFFTLETIDSTQQLNLMMTISCRS